MLVFFIGVPKVNVPKTELMEFLLFQCLPVLPSSVGTTQSPFPTHVTGRILGLSQYPSFPSSPPFPATILYRMPSSRLCQVWPLPAPQIFFIPSVPCLHTFSATATLHLQPFYMLLSLFPILAIASKHQSSRIKSHSKTLPGCIASKGSSERFLAWPISLAWCSV